MFTKTALVLAVPFLVIGAVHAAPHPNMYVNAAEIAAIAAQVEAGSAPWFGAHKQLIAAANSALSLAPQSVTFQGRSGRAYFTQKPYCGWPTSRCGASCCDGDINPNSDRGDYVAAIAASHAIRDLGIAYAFTGNAAYADKAIALIDVWSVDQSTAMQPRFTNGQSDIELSITMPGLFYGADMMWNYPGWATVKRDAFVSWVRAFAADVRSKSTSTNTNNFGDWRLVLLASASVITEDADLLAYVVDHFNALVPNQIDGAGATKKERGRTNGLSYSTYAISAIAQVCEIVRHHGVDLYTVAGGKADIERAFDWVAPFVESPSSWPLQQISSFSGENTAAFELAYLAWGKAEHLRAIERWGRPRVDERTAGPLTLTHARGAYAWRVWSKQAGAAVRASAMQGEVPWTAVFSGLESSGGEDEIVSWAWDFGDGDTGDGPSIEHTFTSPGTFTVSLVIGTSGGARADASITVSAQFADTTPPQLVSATSVPGAQSVVAQFSEPVEVSSAERSGNYMLVPGAKIVAASLAPDGLTLTLSVAGLSPGQYRLYASDIGDRARNPNKIATDASVDFVVPEVVDTIDGWMSQPFTRQTAVFIAEVEVVPESAEINAVFGLSSGPASAYGQLATTVQFAEDGRIYVRDADVYRADTRVDHQTGQNTRLRFEVDVGAQVYHVDVALGGGPSVRLASGYSFRSFSTEVDALDHWSSFAAQGKLLIDGFQLVDPSGDQNGDPGPDDSDAGEVNSPSGDGDPAVPTQYPPPAANNPVAAGCSQQGNDALGILVALPLVFFRRRRK